jgi:CDGSH-type Zn-finger protein
MPAKPAITCLPDGPYLYSEQKKALCRCGGSASKPYCDGTHRRNGFSDRNLADPAKNKRRSYAGKRIAVLDNRALCAHVGYCTDGLPEVFRHRDQPWIEPDAAAAEEIIATVRKCPSGALSYAVDGAEAAPPQRAPNVTPLQDGPYAVTGGVELRNATFGDGASREHYTLCRCGASRNKPFCDGSHWGANFRDASALDPA